MEKIIRQMTGQEEEPIWMAVFGMMSIMFSIFLFIMYCVALGAK